MQPFVPGGRALHLGLPEGEKWRMVGTGRFELPTPRTPSECSTRLSHVPTQIRTERSEGVRRRFYHWEEDQAPTPSFSKQIEAGSSQSDHDRFRRDFRLGRSSNKAN
jgi:hypothetical protein